MSSENSKNESERSNLGLAGQEPENEQTSAPNLGLAGQQTAPVGKPLSGGGKDEYNLVIPSSVTSIGDEWFFGLTDLRAVEIPNSVTAIGYSAFYNCKSLAKIRIPASVGSIGRLAFSGCESLTEISVESGSRTYASVDGVLFSRDGKKLEVFPGGKRGSYAVPPSVTAIMPGAFSSCYWLTAVALPASVTTVGTMAFERCCRLQEISVAAGNPVFSSVDGVLFSEDAFGRAEKILVAYPGGREGAYTIPDSVSVVQESAFADCLFLTEVDIPSSVVSIQFGTFNSCYNLRRVTIPETVASIGESAFFGCHALRDVTLPEEVSSVGKSAFAYCGEGGLTLTILNPDCRIAADPQTIDPSAVVRGRAGSTAEAYAKKYSRKFLPL